MSWYQGKYDPSDFNVPPEQKGGHSQKLQFNIQSGHMRAIETALRSGVFPFGSAQDFGRWAIREALVKINQLEPALITTDLKMADVITRRLQREVVMAKFEENFDLLRTTVQQYTGRGAKHMAVEEVLQTYRDIECMPDQPKSQAYWKQQWMDRLFKEFGYLIPDDLNQAA